MARRLVPILIGSTGLLLALGAPATAPQPRPEAQVLGLSAVLCGAGRASSALIRELGIARAMATPASQARPIPLYPDLTRSPFRIRPPNRGRRTGSPRASS